MLNKEKGITLIALIITIIVMLILVGVTVNIALNGGLFTKADDAKESTQLAMDKEELQMEIVTAYDEDNKGVDLETLKDNLEKKGWKDIIITGDKLTCTSPKGNTFTVDGAGKVTEIPNNDDDNDDNDDDDDDNDNVDKSTDLERYLFNEDGTGKTGLLTMDENTEAITFVDDPDTIADASTSIIYMNNGSENGEYYVVIEYKGADYKVNVTGFNFATAAATVGSDEEKVTKLPTIYEGTDEETKIKQYFTGYSGTGKYLINLLDMQLSEQQETYIFKNNSIIPNAAEKIVLAGIGGDNFTIIYNDTTIYKVQIDSNSMTAKVVTKEGIIEPKTYPCAYGDYEKVMVYEESTTEKYLLIKELDLGDGQVIPANIAVKMNIKLCNDLTTLSGFKSTNELQNPMNISYTQALVSTNEDGEETAMAVWSEKTQAWYFVIWVSGSSPTATYGVVIIPGALTKNTNVTQEQIDTIKQIASESPITIEE